MGTSQFAIYNKALRYMEQRPLASPAENRQPKRAFDAEFDDNNLYCLEAGNWTFAMREAEFQAETNVQPNFGFEYAFQKPSDWNHTFKLSDNEQYDPLLIHWTDQNGFWYADVSPIYVKWISNDPNYGLNLGIWSLSYTEFVAARLAWLCAPTILQNDSKQKRLDNLIRMTKNQALAKDSQNLPAAKVPYGTWTMSRAPRGSIVPYGSPFPGSDDF